MAALSAMQMDTLVSEAEAAKSKERKRNALVLLLRYLHDNGYADSASGLQHESSVSLEQFDAADNVTLE
eukprot:CAMPEP_0181382160 /NCGR_PEP_ID=MMETSP1106-20121128/20571_1 /TAXON_ID=81844 /ORGANISM="Mantoniella antarctica, Strain SL-175" /LENGTH=68 /DNA_ID=CAMNT_0023501521 /DNA_START=126 /DNA_END=329 /DNA_ORIENTATION=-